MKAYAEKTQRNQNRLASNAVSPKPSDRESGLPDNLKAGIENLSRYSMDDVKVHYNSDKPAQINAHAYVQGSDIHLASGQEKHLPHEAWHVVQQKQGRVKPSSQMKGGMSLNDDMTLEKEADVMGSRALLTKPKENRREEIAESADQMKSDLTPNLGVVDKQPVQRKITVGALEYDTSGLIKQLQSDENVVWHDKYEPILKELDKQNAQFPSLPDLLLRMGGIIVAQESPQDMLQVEYWKKKLEAIDKDKKGLYQKTQMFDYWETYDPMSIKDRKQETKRTTDKILKEHGPQLLKEIQEAGRHYPEQLRLYRAMSNEEAQAIMEWDKSQRESTETQVRKGGISAKEFRVRKDTEIMPIKNHLGDKKQAESYYKTGENKLLEFTLKPGAHEVLFDPDYMAIARSGKGALPVIAEYVKNKPKQQNEKEKIFPPGSDSEGKLPGYIGLKAEQKGDFSLSLGESDATHLLFQLLIDKIRIIGE